MKSSLRARGLGTARNLLFIDIVLYLFAKCSILYSLFRFMRGSGQFMVIAVVALVVLKVLISSTLRSPAA